MIWTVTNDWGETYEIVISPFVSYGYRLYDSADVLADSIESWLEWLEFVNGQGRP